MPLPVVRSGKPGDMTEIRRRGSAWLQLGHGVQMPADLTGDEAFRAEMAAWMPLLPPSAVYTGLTAIKAHGLWLPPVPNWMPLFVAMGSVAGEVKPDRSRLAVSRHPTPPARVDVAGAPVASIPEALLACARHLCLLDLVVVIDSALHLGRCTVRDLEEAAAPRLRGSPALRRALGWSDPRAESAWEVVLRLLHRHLGVGVTPQVDIADDRGRFVGRADLLLDGTRTLHEYDGEHHRDAQQHRRDLHRERELANAGYTRRGYGSGVLITRAHAVLRDCEAALGRPLDFASVREWNTLLATSLFTGAGQQHVLRRLRRNWSHLAAIDA